MFREQSEELEGLYYCSVLWQFHGVTPRWQYWNLCPQNKNHVTWNLAQTLHRNHVHLFLTPREGGYLGGSYVRTPCTNLCILFGSYGALGCPDSSHKELCDVPPLG